MKVFLNIILVCILSFSYVAKAETVNVDYCEPSPVLLWKQWQKQKSLLKEADVDFSKISKNHPRMFFKDDEVAFIKSKLDKNVLLKKLHNELIYVADKMLKASKLSYQLDESGRRLLAISRQYLKRILTLTYAYKLTGDKKYLHAVEQEMLNSAAFKDWNPSHFLDTAEMALGVAIGYDALYNDLSQSTKDILTTALIEKAIKQDSWGFGAINNWNQVCNAGVLAASIAVFEKDKALTKRVILRAINANPVSLQAYVPDGVYLEGVGYWGYGTTFQVVLIETLRNSFGTDFGLSKSEGFLNSARFVSASISHNKKAFNFADNRVGVSESLLPTLFWFANKTNDVSVLTPFNEELKRPLIFKGKYPRLMPVLVKEAASIDIEKISGNSPALFVGRGNCAVATIKTSDKEKIFLGVKAGKGDNIHSHLDVGSFVFDIGKNRWIHDIEIVSYALVEARKTDLWNMNNDSERWSLIRYRNQFHSTITADDKNHNISGLAYITNYWNSKNEYGVKIDMQKVLAPSLTKAERTFKIINEAYLEITDVLQASDKDIKISFPLPVAGMVKIVSGNEIELSQNKCKLSISASGNLNLKAKMFDTSLRNKKDFPLKNFSLPGFEYTIPAGKTAEVKTTFKLKK